MVCDKERWCVCVTKQCVKDGVCVKVVCERERVTKLCAKDGMWQSGVWKMVWRKMVCDKVVCERWCGERWCVTKLCVKDGVVKDGVWQSSVWRMVWWKMVCDKVVCERWCVKDGVLQRLCVKEGVSKMVCDKVVCQRWCVTKLCVKNGVVTKWCVEDGVVKDGVWQSGVWQSGVWQSGVKDGVWQSGVWKRVCQRWCHACHAKRRWMWDCATPATPNEGRCRQVPRLPRKVPRRHQRQKPTQAHHPVPKVPCLPRKTKVDVRLCHACHAKRRWMWPSATPATQSAAASPATKTDPSAPPSAISATPVTQNEGGCDQVPRLPRETKVDVTKCHACHAKCRGVTGD